MNAEIELCGIVLGNKFEESKFIIKNKEVIPGGDCIVTIQNTSQKFEDYFGSLNIIYPFGGKEISMIVAESIERYTKKNCLDIINNINDVYLEKYGSYYDIYFSENKKECSYLYYFYPPNYNVISINNQDKEHIIQLLLWANKQEFEDCFRLEAVLSYYEELEDEKYPEEKMPDKEKTLLKISGLD